MTRNMSINNRGNPIEENGDLEVGGVGSHGEPYPGRDLWQWHAGLMSINNITIRDSWVDGGDNNVCNKNDTFNFLVENIVFYNGHGATIGENNGSVMVHALAFFAFSLDSLTVVVAVIGSCCCTVRAGRQRPARVHHQRDFPKHHDERQRAGQDQILGQHYRGSVEYLACTKM